MEEAFFAMWPPRSVFPKLAFMFSILHLLFNQHDFLNYLNSGAQDDLLENGCYLQIMNILFKVQHFSREPGILGEK